MILSAIWFNKIERSNNFSPVEICCFKNTAVLASHFRETFLWYFNIVLVLVFPKNNQSKNQKRTGLLC